MKHTKKIIATFLCAATLSSCAQKKSDAVTIGIIEPVEIAAMTDIIRGFKTTLARQYNKPITIKVMNAQNDPNIQRAIIQQMHDASYSMIVPIGTSATQMTLSMIHKKPVIGFAIDMTQKQRFALKHCNVAIVHDDIQSMKLLEFIHAVYPKMITLAFINSSADNIFPEVKQTIADAKKLGIAVHDIMVSSLPELTTAAQNLPSDTQGIFVLKDELIVSGISTLAKVSETKHIPLITSDEGSVQNGAAFALGVHESETGVQDAMLAAQVLNGKPICSLPIAGMKNLTVFVNPEAIKKEGQDINAITTAANHLNYKTETLRGNA